MVFFFAFFAINLHVQFAFFTLDLQHVLEGQLFCMFFSHSFCKFAISGQNLWESLKNTKNTGKFAKKCKQIAKKKQNKRTRLKLGKKKHVICIFCKFPSGFCISPASPEVLPGNCKFAKKMQKNAPKTSPSRTCCKSNAKKMQKKSKFKMQNEPAIQKNANQSCKKKNKNKPSPIPTRDALSWN